MPVTDHTVCVCVNVDQVDDYAAGLLRDLHARGLKGERVRLELIDNRNDYTAAVRLDTLDTRQKQRRDAVEFLRQIVEYKWAMKEGLEEEITAWLVTYDKTDG